MELNTSSTFTPIHRILGEQRGPLTEAMLDRAISQEVEEVGDLDWKSKLPPRAGINQSDFPKDVAAMANSGGGIIVYGVKEKGKAATKRSGVAEFAEGHERSLRSAAVSAISPPIFGLNFLVLGSGGNTCVALGIPRSAEVAHLIYKSDFFGAPVRNGADTTWLTERQVGEMYRLRFEGQRRAAQELGDFYGEGLAGRDTDRRAWFIAAARPRLPNIEIVRPLAGEVASILQEATTLTDSYTGNDGFHPIHSVDIHNPRPGLRRWVARFRSESLPEWKEAWASVHHDGSASMAAAVGGHRSGASSHFEGGQVLDRTFERSISDFMALVRAVSLKRGHSEYEVTIGLEFTGENPLSLVYEWHDGLLADRDSLPVAAYSPVNSTVEANAADLEYLEQIHELMKDCLNQGGIPDPRLLRGRSD